MTENWSEKCKIETEKYIGNADGVSCNCDIVISHSDSVFFIENKILSSESDHPDSDLGQLERYYQASKYNKIYSDKKKIYIYLTPGGKAPGNAEVWEVMTYKYLIKKGLELLENPKNNISNPAKSNLLQFLMDLSVMSYDSFLTDLDKMKNIADLIQNNFSLNKALIFNKLKRKYQTEFKIIEEAYNG
ncbi:MAG: PD-(D/E)XK nuclease family protein [bacterium]